MKEKIIAGKTCRYYIKGGIWISYDGNVAAIVGKSGRIIQLNILYDDRCKFVILPSGFKISIAKAVMTCFCKPLTEYSEAMINYKDGNRLNCYYKNLEYVPFRYLYNPNESTYLHIGDSFITVHSSGYVSGQTIYNSIPDRDLGENVCVEPFIIPKKQKLPMDDIMEIAGYVRGCKESIADPVILHIDYSWLNFNTSNLLWVSREDPRYKEYLLRRK